MSKRRGRERQKEENGGKRRKSGSAAESAARSKVGHYERGSVSVEAATEAHGRQGSMDIDEIEENARFWDFANSFIDAIPSAST